jgi:FKBP-type peptidyl-prolyl cis-trans isomerase FkpA/FKBP-type peptidyl-prolyl cis-trans isomerase FklB
MMLNARYLLFLPVLLVAVSMFAVACGDDDDAGGTEAEVAGASGQEGIPLTAPDDAIATGSGLKFFDIKEGDGAQPSASQSVVVHYKGTLTDGTVFDSSYDRGAPAEFPLNGVIPGFAEGISTMKIGGHRVLYIPSDLGYGAQGYPPVIPANADLIFEVELIEIR